MPSNVGALLRRARDTYGIHAAWDLLVPLTAFLLIGVLCLLGSLAFPPRRIDLAYFLPSFEIFTGAFRVATNSSTALNTAARFGTMYCLGAVFLSCVRARYFALGFEGALIGSVTVVAVLSVALTGSVATSPLAAGAGGLIVLAGVAALFLAKSRGFYSRAIDDVTPGIVVNVVAVPFALAVLSAFRLQDPQAVDVATIASANAFILRDDESRFALASAIVWTCLGLGSAVATIHRRTALGLHLRAVGANREAAWLAGISMKRVTVLLSITAAVFVACAAMVQYLVHGRLVVGILRDQVAGPIAAALIGRLSFVGLPFGVFAVLGLSEFNVFLQHSKGAPPETVHAFQGVLLVVLAIIVPLRRPSSNG